MISVVMASYLGTYKGAAKDRVTKFHRAVNSFLAQDADAELIVVSDGCQQTLDECPQDTRIRLITGLQKQPTWSPVVRNCGIYHAKGTHIAYLDTDDTFGEGHLATLAAYLPEQYGLFNDHIWHRQQWVEREVSLKKFRCGTSNLIHRAGWFWPDDANDYAHDHTFIAALKLLGPPQHIPTPRYLVHHIPNRYDR